MTTCNTCTWRQQNPNSGRYNMRCVHCCAHLVKSARPLKHAQEAMFACIARHEGAPSKPEIIRTIETIDRARDEQQLGKALTPT